MSRLISMRFDGLDKSYAAGDMVQGVLYIKTSRDVKLESITITVRCEESLTISPILEGFVYQKQVHQTECVYERYVQTCYNEDKILLARSVAALSFEIPLPETYGTGDTIYLSATTQLLVGQNVKSKFMESVEVFMVDE